jgi:hypothetical protein
MQLRFWGNEEVYLLRGSKGNSEYAVGGRNLISGLNFMYGGLYYDVIMMSGLHLRRKCAVTEMRTFRLGICVPNEQSGADEDQVLCSQAYIKNCFTKRTACSISWLTTCAVLPTLKICGVKTALPHTPS